MISYKTIEQFATESGYTPDAIRTKIKRGVWIEGYVWLKAPDNRVLINIEGYNEWVISTPALNPPPITALKSGLDIGANTAKRGSRKSPQPPI